MTPPYGDGLATNCGFSLGNEKATTNTSVRISSLNLDGDYYFRVHAVNPVGKGDWTAELDSLLKPSLSGRVRVSPTVITVDDLADAAFVYTGSTLIPTGWTHPRARTGATSPTTGTRA